MNYFPIFIMVLNFLAAGVYIFYGEMGKALYWLSAGLLNLSVIFLI